MGVNSLLIGTVILGMITQTAAAYTTEASIKKLCEDSEILLQEGLESSVLVSLDTSLIRGACRVTIKAPKTHVVHMTVVEISSPPYLQFRKRFPQQPACNLTVFQGDTVQKPVWSGDLCSNGLLRNVDLLNPEISLLWKQPSGVSSTHNRKLLFTAVGLGDVCKRNDQHTCMSIGHKPLFCISDQLICDGYQNCPRGATKSDEDTHLCSRFTNLNELHRFLKDDMFAENILNSLRKTSEKPLFNIPKIWGEFSQIETKETTTPEPDEEKPTTALESISMTLSQYGPWGYILLGMLLCAAVLMFCGVIECLRKPKPIEAVQSSPTTVLIINSQQDEATPPRYEDLDPPSYITLFPNVKIEDEPVNGDADAHTSETASSTRSEASGQQEAVAENVPIEQSTSSWRYNEEADDREQPTQNHVQT